MTPSDDLPDEMKTALRKETLHRAKFDDCLPLFELSLCEWYLRENSEIVEKMLADELAYVKEQLSWGNECPNDSGIVAVEYYTKRIRYADIIYMCSLAETFLNRACEKLDFILDDGSPPFQLKRTDNKWLKCREYLQNRAGISLHEEAWTLLQHLRVVRNLIAHENGTADELEQKEEAAISCLPGIRVRAHELVIEKECLEVSLASFKTLVESTNAQLARLADSRLMPE
jgi:hypothetical protein